MNNDPQSDSGSCRTFCMAIVLFSLALVVTSTGVFGLAGLVLAVLYLCIVGFIRSPSREGRIIAAGVFLVLAFGLCLLPAVSRAREPARQAACRNNLKQIILALAAYREVHGHFPPAHVTDAEGKPMHSWRVLILPYMDSAALYKQYDFNEPWDGLNNRKLADAIISEYVCPSETHWAEEPSVTDYVVVTGPTTLWPAAEPGKMPGVPETAANTIVVAEIADSDIHWMEPRGE